MKRMSDYEKLGVFYLGKIIDDRKKRNVDEFLYESKNLTTHAVCVGMTGSGKTGLGIALIEEAGLDKVPSILIDPKGDLCNLLLTFPNLSPDEFRPWIDDEEAARAGKTPEQYAVEVSKKWRNGLAEWDEEANKIQTLRSSVDMMIYTPASSAGVPISILKSFAAPPKEQLKDTEAFHDKVQTTTTGLLGLIGIQADPIKSREYILISSIIDYAWQKGNDLELAKLIQQVQKPPFSKIGALDIDTFFPQRDRMELSIRLNNLLASPNFHAWLEGEPLDIQSFLYSSEGKPKISIISIAHLAESERMFFVTILLNEFLSWMRRQPGTSSLRAILYMDEIFGYFPPVAVPPSKLPMLTLLKQARAYGIGVVLATQNPVDLDYKGLSNCGTWFIGKLQTERDKMRVVEGLKVASNETIDTAKLDKLLASIQNRVFILHSIYKKNPLLFQTRWTMSYLRGPLTLSQIEKLTEKKKSYRKTEVHTEGQKISVQKTKPVIPPDVPEFFVNLSEASELHYKPFIAGFAKLHFVNAKQNVDTWQDVCLVAAIDDDKTIHWEKGKYQPDLKSRLENAPAPHSTFEDLPGFMMQKKTYELLKKSLAAALYQNRTYKIFKVSDLKESSEEGETEEEFRLRMVLVMREKREEIIKKLRSKHEKKIAALAEKVRRAQEKVTELQERKEAEKTDTLISFGTTILDALLGGRKTRKTVSDAGDSIQKAGRIGRRDQEIVRAQADLQSAQQKLTEIENQLKEEIDQVSIVNPKDIQLETITLRPRKSDISVNQIALIWVA